MATCVFCKRETGTESRHHLIPTGTHTKKRVKKTYTAEERMATVEACRDCHSTIHATFTEVELAYQYFTVDKLMADERFAKFVNWVKNKTYNGRNSIKMRNDRK